MEDVKHELSSRKLQFLEPDLPRFVELQNRFHLTTSLLVSKWDAFLLNHNGLSSNSFEIFATGLAKQASRKRERGMMNAESIDKIIHPSSASSTPTSSSNPSFNSNSNSNSISNSSGSGSGVIKSMGSPPASVPSVVKRANSSGTSTTSAAVGSPGFASVLGSPPQPATSVLRDPKTLLSHNGSLPAYFRSGNGSDAVVSLSAKNDLPRSKFRYMWQRADEIRMAMEDIISIRGSKILQNAGIDESLLVSANHASAEPVFVVGMLALDTSVQYGKLNLFSAELVDVDGNAVKLDFRDYLQNQQANAEQKTEDKENEQPQKAAVVEGLFPGQILVVQGMNADGSTLMVQNIFSIALGPLKQHPLMPKSDAAQDQGSPGFSICILAGPFGGFVRDALAKARLSHAVVVTGMLTTLEERAIQEFQSEAGIPVLVIPCHESESSDFCVFPQPGNPCIVEVSTNQSSFSPLSVGFVSVDVLAGLAKEEMALVKDRDRFASLCRHLLDQGSFYPLVPPADNIPMDLTLLDKLQFADRPNVIVLPSVLQHFVKDVDGTICINPRLMQNRQLATIHVGADSQIRVDVERI
eukprot:ANDGO_05901.mRNA.1 DNA polymerase alpha subunit B